MRSLGWTEIAEDDLTPERSSKAVNKCIVDLSLGRNDLLDVVGRWGDVSSLRFTLLLRACVFYGDTRKKLDLCETVGKKFCHDRVELLCPREVV